MTDETKIENINYSEEEEVSVELASAKAAAPVAEKPAPTEAESDTAPENFDDGEGQLAIDVYQTDASIVIESPIAGVTDPESLDISITNESVTIKGKRERSKTVKEEDYFYQECYWGRFSRSVILPQEIDPEKADASIKNGILTIKLPKLHRQKSKKLRVKFG